VFALGGTGKVLPRRLWSPQQKAIAEAEDLREVLEPLIRAVLSYRAMADALAGVGKFSSTGHPLPSAQIGQLLQYLGLWGKLLGSDQVWVVA
jgi:hypothetical protein